MNLKTETVLDLISNLWTGRNLEGLDVKRVPFYGALYDRTFGAQDASHVEELTKYIGELPSGYHVIECFAGNGFESYIRAKQFPDLTFHCLDLQDYEGKYELPNLHYHIWDCLDLAGFKSNFVSPVGGEIGCVFVGPTNASLVELDYKLCEKYFRECQKVVVEGGLVILSGATTNDEDERIMFDVSDENPNWATLMHKKQDSETYHNILIEDGTLYVSDEYIVHCHSFAWVKAQFQDKKILTDDYRLLVIKN